MNDRIFVSYFWQTLTDSGVFCNLLTSLSTCLDHVRIMSASCIDHGQCLKQVQRILQAFRIKLENIFKAYPEYLW